MTNIEMNILKENNQYEVLLPKTDYNLLLNKPNITSGTTALTAGSSALPTGDIYLMYE